MFALARRICPASARLQSQRTTVRTPLSSTGFQPVSSQNSQGMRAAGCAREKETAVYQRLVARGVSVSAAGVDDEEVCEVDDVCGAARTRSVGVDFTSAVDSR